MTFANYSEQDEAPQNMRPHLDSKLFDTETISVNFFYGNNEILQNLNVKKNRKIYSTGKCK